MHLRSILRPFLTALLLLLLASPAWAVILVLKDGQQMSVKKYERKGTKVIVILTSGTMTEMAASEVDFEATEELNAGSGGSGDRIFNLDDEDPSTPPPPPDRGRTSSDLAGSSHLSRPDAPVQADDGTANSDLPRTTAGFVDLAQLQRVPYGNAQALAEISQYLESQGVELFGVFAGSAADRPLLVVQAESESVVFKVLKDAASAFIQTNARYSEVAALELLMETGNGLGGQFVLTPDLAQPLATGRMSPQLFFIRYVQF